MDNSIGIGDLAALVTVAGIAVYVMGLIGFSLTISFNFTGDLTTAWYAVSLLPRTVVAGQGMRLWLRWPLIVTAILLPTAQISGGPFLLSLAAVIGSVAAGSFGMRSYHFSRRLERHPSRRIRELVTTVCGLIVLSLGIFMLTDGALLIAQDSSLPSPGFFVSDALKALGIAVEENSFAIGVILIFSEALRLASQQR